MNVSMDNVKFYKLFFQKASILIGVLAFSFAIHAQTVGADGIRFYQKHIGAIKGYACSMHPSCSQYAALAFQTKSFPQAVLYSFDRLNRCGNDQNRYIVDQHLLEDPLPVSIIDFRPISKNAQLFFDLAQIEVDSCSAPLLVLVQREQYESAICMYELLPSTDQAKTYNRLLKAVALAKSNREDLLWLFSKSILLDSNTLKNFNLHLGLLEINLNQSEHAGFLEQELKRGSQFWKHPLYMKYTAYLALKSNRFHISKSILQDLEKLQPTLVPQLFQVVENQENHKLKKEGIASLLGVFPGLGYAYAGFPKTAFTSFVVIGLFSWVAYEGIDREMYGLASVSGLFGLGFYVAGIKGSAWAAIRFNAQQKQKSLNRFLEIQF